MTAQLQIKPARLPNGRKPRALVVNCYSDCHAATRGSPGFVPQPVTPLYLAGAFNAATVDVDVHCEFHGGPLQDLGRLAWPDLLVLTGLNAAFDRMRHLAAYAKAQNPAVVTVVGGSLARIMPRLCARWFDVVCDGDVEGLMNVARDQLGPGCVAETLFPRYDLSYGLSFVGYAESTRNCNFRCTFCSMSAEDRPFLNNPANFIRQQVEAMGPKHGVIFVDQNFSGGPRRDFLARMAEIRALHDEGLLRGWAAMVTADFFKRPQDVQAAAASGCIGFYSGVESFSRAQIEAFNKRQNLVLPQEQVIRRCLEAGMVFHYGLVLDPTERSIDEFQQELELIVSNPRITLPAFVSIAIPILGTPLFRRRLAESAFLPNLRLADMDGQTLLCHPREPLPRVAEYVRRVQTTPLARHKLVSHAARFYLRYRGTLRGWSMASALMNTISMGMPAIGTNQRERRVPRGERRRDFVGGRGPIGSLYRPAMPLPSELAPYFIPQPVTDAAGALHPDLSEDLGTTEAPRTAVGG